MRTEGGEEERKEGYKKKEMERKDKLCCEKLR